MPTTNVEDVLQDFISSECIVWNFSGDTIRRKGARLVARALKDDAVACSLQLNGNNVGPEGAQALAAALKVNGTLQRIHLKNNSIGNSGARSLASALKVNIALQRIDLGKNNIGPRGLRFIAAAMKVNVTLQSLDLGGNAAGLEGVFAVAEALKVNGTLQRIDLNRCDIGSDGAYALAEALKVNTTLLRIDISGNDLGPEGVWALAKALKVNETLQRFELKDANVGTEGVEYLAESLKENVALLQVDFSRNDLGPEGAWALSQALKVNATLQRIGLRGANVGTEGAEYLAESLKENIALRQVDLSGSNVGPEGASAMLEALKWNATLQLIHLHHNGIESRTLRCIKEQLEFNCNANLRKRKRAEEQEEETPQAPLKCAMHDGFIYAIFGRKESFVEEEDEEDQLVYAVLHDGQAESVTILSLDDLNGCDPQNRPLDLDRVRRLELPVLRNTGVANLREHWRSLSEDRRAELHRKTQECRVAEAVGEEQCESNPSVSSHRDGESQPPPAESVLFLHRLLGRVLEQRRRTRWPPAEAPAAPPAAILPCFSGLLAELREAARAAEGQDRADERKEEVASVRQRVAAALAQLADKQRIIRTAAASLPASHGEDAIEAELREKVAARDESRRAAWQALRDAPASLLRAVGGGAAGPETVEARAAELQRRIGDVVAALDLCCRAALRPAGLGQLGGRSAALEEGCRVTLPDLLKAHDDWQAACSLAGLAQTTDASLEAATAMLRQTSLLVPVAPETEEEAQRLAAAMQAVETSLRAELAARERWAPDACFPAPLVMEGARQLIASWQADVSFLQDVRQQLSEWEGQALLLKRAIDDAEKKDGIRQWLRAARQRLRVARATVKAADAQCELAEATGVVGPELAVGREAAQRAVVEAKVGLRAATAEIIEAVGDFPELACYVELGLPEPLLPLWEKERSIGDFEDLQLLPGPSRNRVYRGRLAGQCCVVKGFPMPAGGAHTCLREALRLVRAAHPHVVEVTALFQDVATQTFFLQMPDYTEGPLDEWAAAHQPDVPSLRRALRQAFDGVAHLHFLGIIHSDLKPANLLVAASGVVRVGDLDVSVDLATRTSARYATTAFVGFTAGFAAPELLQTGATAATDAFSLGAVVREVGRRVPSGAGEEADDLVRQLCAEDPVARPAVAPAMQHAYFLPAVAWQRTERRGCCVFASELCEYGEQPVPLERGVQCGGAGGGEQHFTCDECLEQHVRTFLNSDIRTLRGSEGRVQCPQCMAGGAEGGNGHRAAYPDAELARHLPAGTFGRYVALRLRLTEQQLAEQFDRDLQAALEADRRRLAEMDERQRRVTAARRHVEEEVLNLHCPRCHQVFLDFDGCCALVCSRCPCSFCAWCGRDCGADAHQHVARCAQRPPGVADVFAPEPVWREHQRLRRRRLAAEYFATLDPETRRAVWQELRPHLADLQLEVL